MGAIQRGYIPSKFPTNKGKATPFPLLIPQSWPHQLYLLTLKKPSDGTLLPMILESKTFLCQGTAILLDQATISDGVLSIQHPDDAIVKVKVSAFTNRPEQV